MSTYDHRRQVCTTEDVEAFQMSTPAAPAYSQPMGNAAVIEQMSMANPETQLGSYTSLPEAGESESTAQGIEICSRVAELPVAEQVGLQHRWIRTPNMERGIGPADGGVPGVDGDQGDKPYSDTMVTDHAGQGANPASTCVPAEEWNPAWANVDQDCVERLSQVGNETGPWTPLLNDCHRWVDRTMNACDPDHMTAAEMRDAELEMIRNREIPYVGSSFKPMP